MPALHLKNISMKLTLETGSFGCHRWCQAFFAHWVTPGDGESETVSYLKFQDYYSDTAAMIDSDVTFIEWVFGYVFSNFFLNFG